MSSRMNLKAKRELVRVVAEKYQRAGRHDKHKILEQFVAVTGYHRKHSIRLLNSTAELVTPRRTRRFRVYDEAVKQALVVLWEASDRICGKRLKALLPILVPALERHGHLDLEGTIRERLLSASASTIDRLLAEARDGIRGSTRPKRRAKTAVQRQVPIRTAGDWNDPLPGYVEADLVSHCGTNPGGSFGPHPDSDRCLYRVDRVHGARRPWRVAGRRSAGTPSHHHAIPPLGPRYRQRKRVS